MMLIIIKLENFKYNNYVLSIHDLQIWELCHTYSIFEAGIFSIMFVVSIHRWDVTFQYPILNFCDFASAHSIQSFKKGSPRHPHFLSTSLSLPRFFLPSISKKINPLKSSVQSSPPRTRNLRPFPVSHGGHAVNPLPLLYTWNPTLNENLRVSVSMAGGISKLGTALAVVFVALVVALFAQLVFVLWRRRAFRRSIPPVYQAESGSGDVESQSQSSSFFSAPSKELFLFFCLRTDTHLARIEPSTTPSLHNSTGSTPESPEMELVDLLKLQSGLYGPSKILFTIKEEEKEDLESVCSSVEKGPKKKTNSKRRSLEDFFEIDRDSPEISPEVVVTAADDCHLEIESTPFSTPCTSPTYFTPSASPAREKLTDL